MSQEHKDSMKKIEMDLKKFMINQSNKAFDEGVMTVIDTLRGAMGVSGLKFIPPMWLDTIEEEVKKKLLKASKS